MSRERLSRSVSKEVKHRVSSRTMQENQDSNVKNVMLMHVMGDKHRAEMERISNIDAHSMLESISKELKLTDYTLSRCITSGTDHFTKLEVTT